MAIDAESHSLSLPERGLTYQFSTSTKYNLLNLIFIVPNLLNETAQSWETTQSEVLLAKVNCCTTHFQHNFYPLHCLVISSPSH